MLVYMYVNVYIYIYTHPRIPECHIIHAIYIYLFFKHHSFQGNMNLTGLTNNKRTNNCSAFSVAIATGPPLCALLVDMARSELGDLALSYLHI